MRKLKIKNRDRIFKSDFLLFDKIHFKTMFKVVFILSVFLTSLNATQGNVFTDPNKLTHLVKFHLSAKSIFSSSKTDDLVTLPKEVLVELTR